MPSNKPDDYFIFDTENSEQQGFLNQLIQIGLRFLSSDKPSHEFYDRTHIASLKKIVAEPLPVAGASLQDLLNILENTVVKHSTNMSDAHFIGFPTVANSVASISADIINAFLNQNLIANFPCAPIATFIEIQTILWLRELVGYSTFQLDTLPNLANVGGLWTYGGNISNFIAVLVALHNKYPDIRQHGLFNLQTIPSIVMAQGLEHFSYADALATFGVGSDAIIWTKYDKNFNLDVEYTEQLIAQHQKRGKLAPFMLVCVAGNTRTGNIDNIKKCAELCVKYNLWLHVDACHGGSLLFSRKLRSKLAGIELADSVSLDPHKGLFITYPSSCILFKDPLKLVCCAKHQQMIFREDIFDLGLISPFFGSKAFHSLKFWLLVKHCGLSGLAQLIEQRHEINQQFTEKLINTNLFIALNENEIYKSILVFLPKEVHGIIKKLDPDRYCACSQVISKYNWEFVKSLRNNSQIFFDCFSLCDSKNQIGMGNTQKYDIIAIVIGHAVMTEDKINELVNICVHKAEQLKDGLLRDFTRKQHEPNNKNLKISPAEW
jgi:L-2,4-diaminobutyrate decarboxylase